MKWTKLDAMRLHIRMAEMSKANPRRYRCMCNRLNVCSVQLSLLFDPSFIYARKYFDTHKRYFYGCNLINGVHFQWLFAAQSNDDLFTGAHTKCIYVFVHTCSAPSKWIHGRQLDRNQRVLKCLYGQRRIIVPHSSEHYPANNNNNNSCAALKCM